MKKYGGFIPGIRAGRPTAEYLSYVLNRITWPGSLYLGLIALVPTMALVALRCEPELPVRRDQHPDHRGCRSRDREADREPAPAAQLRRVPPLMRIVLVGPPGAGKGTQAAFLAKNLSIPHISTGDLFRANISRRHGARQARQGLHGRAATWCPDEVTIAHGQGPHGAAGRRRAASCWTASRATCSQAEALDEMLADRGHEAGRGAGPGGPRGRGRQADRRPPHLPQRLARTSSTSTYKPPKKDGVCDVCGGELYQRDDDTEETVRNRLEVYHTQTEPIIDYYKAAGPGGHDLGARQGGRGHRRAPWRRSEHEGDATSGRPHAARSDSRGALPGAAAAVRVGARTVELSLGRTAAGRTPRDVHMEGVSRMVQIKTPEQIAKMRAAGLVVAAIHAATREAAVPGATTKDLDEVAAQGASRSTARSRTSSGYGGFPGDDLHLGQRRRRPRHPRPTRPSSRTATSSPSTAARSWTAGTATRPSPPSSAAATRRS